MPPSNRSRNDNLPERFRAFTHHGIDLTLKDSQGNADCPFCGADSPKFTVHAETGLWRCWKCGQSGNPLAFIRLVHELGMKAATAAVAFTTASNGPRKLRRHIAFQAALSNGQRSGNGHSEPSAAETLAADRRLFSHETLLAWGVCESPLGNGWIVPGYGADGRLDQLYRYVKTLKGYSLRPTPGIWEEGRGHALHLPFGDFDPARPNVVVCEGPWDGAVIWETKRSVWGEANIIAVPGAGVWQDAWTELCREKHVTLLYDSDHPVLSNSHVARAGYDGMVRVARKLSGIATSIRWLVWGPEGYDPEKPTGWDVRDAITGKPGPALPMTERIVVLTELMDKIAYVPEAITLSGGPTSTGQGKGIEAIPCGTWDECINAWGEAMRWRSTMSDAMAVLLAVCASTKQAGNQLFVQLIGDAGSGKTTMCEGLLTSHHCHHLEHLTGFHSGWKGEMDEKTGKIKDCSLIARINGKTLVTCEADIMMSSPKFDELMSQQRRIFDGKSGASYKNSSEDTLHVGLRTPWIMAGTPALLDKDQSRLGDRFLRVCIEEPDEAEKRAILRSAIRSERVALLNSSNGTAGSILDSKTRKAQALTGGYVNHLRANIEDLLAKIHVPDEVDEMCADLAELAADLRARPNLDRTKTVIENQNHKELPTRLGRQSFRLAQHLAVVLNKETVDSQVMRITRKVAMDTSRGQTSKIAAFLMSRKAGTGMTHQDAGGISTRVLALWLDSKEEPTINYLFFLRAIDVVEYRDSTVGIGAWMLTERVHDLYNRVRMIGS